MVKWMGWEDFHQRLDIAVALMIQEDKNCLPSRTTLMEFMEYSNKKTKEEVDER